MATQSRSRRHHFVPAWYLSNFGAPADKKRKSLLWCYDLKQGKQFPATAECVGSAEDFNTAVVHGQPTDYFEQKTTQLEKLIAPGVDRFLNDPSHDNLFWVLATIALLAGKNPTTRSKLLEAGTEAFYLGAADLVSSPETYQTYVDAAPLFGLVLPHMSYEDAKRAVETRSIDPAIHRNYMLYFELSTIADALEKTLLPRRWRIYQTDPNATGGFITSDNPVVRRVDKDGNSRPGFGIGRPDTTIVFAVSRAIAVIGEFSGKAGSTTAGRKEVAWFNNGTLLYAYRQIYAFNDQFIYDLGGRDRTATDLDEDSALHSSRFEKS